MAFRVLLIIPPYSHAGSLSLSETPRKESSAASRSTAGKYICDGIGKEGPTSCGSKKSNKTIEGASQTVWWNSDGGCIRKQADGGFKKRRILTWPQDEDGLEGSQDNGGI